MEAVHSSINKCGKVSALFNELTKAVDTICHGILPDKLLSAGTRGLSLCWLAGYLFDLAKYWVRNCSTFIWCSTGFGIRAVIRYS